MVYASFPNESMSTMNAVSNVMEFRKAYPERYASIIRELNIENRKAVRAIEAKDMEEFRQHFETGRLLTKRLGTFSGVEIETAKHSKLIEETVQNGAFVAKLPGAGGGDAMVALCLSRENAEKVKKFLKKKELNVLDVNIID